MTPYKACDFFSQTQQRQSWDQYITKISHAKREGGLKNRRNVDQ